MARRLFCCLRSTEGLHLIIIDEGIYDRKNVVNKLCSSYSGMGMG